jgi:hypothetical protein
MSYFSQEERRKSKRFRETSLPQLEFIVIQDWVFSEEDNSPKAQFWF